MCRDLGAAHLAAELGATNQGAELDSHVSVTSAPFVANSFNLGATVHSAELRVHFLKSFKRGVVVRIFQQKG
jgi:hypothetical protein